MGNKNSLYNSVQTISITLIFTSFHDSWLLRASNLIAHGSLHFVSYGVSERSYAMTLSIEKQSIYALIEGTLSTSHKESCSGCSEASCKIESRLSASSE